MYRCIYVYMYNIQSYTMVMMPCGLKTLPYREAIAPAIPSTTNPSKAVSPMPGSALDRPQSLQPSSKLHDCFQMFSVSSNWIRIHGLAARYKTSGKHLSFRMSMDRYEPLIQTFHIICRFPKMGGAPKSFMFIGFATINHPFQATPLTMEPLICPILFPCPANAAISTPGCAPES